MKQFQGRVVVPGTCTAEALVSKGGFNTLASYQMALMFGDKKVKCGDQNNAVLKATKDAIHHCCMAGISEIFGITDRKTQAYIKADIYAPHPEDVDPSVVTDYLEWWGNVDTEVHHGGANPEGINLDGKGKTEITIAIVVLTVYVDV